MVFTCADQFPSGYTSMGNDPANNIDPSGMYSMIFLPDGRVNTSTLLQIETRRYNYWLKCFYNRMFESNTIDPEMLASMRAPSAGDALDMWNEVEYVTFVVYRSDGQKDLKLAHIDRFDKMLRQKTETNSQGLVYIGELVAEAPDGSLLVGHIMIGDYLNSQDAINSIGIESGAMLSINYNTEVQFTDMGYASHITIERITYDVDAARSWANVQEALSSTPMTIDFNESLVGATEWELNGMPVKPMAEVASPMTLISGGIMTISPNDMVGKGQGDLTGVWSNSGVSGIHLHGIPAGFLTYRNGNGQLKGINIKWGPSDGDMSKSGRYYYRMMADPKYIWLYRRSWETIYRFNR